MKFSRTKTLLLLPFLFFEHLYGNELSTYSLYYTVNANGIKGNAQRTLSSVDVNTFELTNSIEARLAGQLVTSLRETSTIELFENSIRPVFYSMQQSGITTTSLEIDYDWSAMLVTSDKPKVSESLEINPNIQDQLSHQIILQQEIIEDNTDLTFTIFNEGDFEIYSYQILGKEKIDTPLGAFDSIKIARSHEANSRRETIFWLAEDFEGILLRAQQRIKPGVNIFLEIRTGTLNGIPISAPN